MIGQTLGHYKIVDKLGAGGMGEVYRAEDATLKRQVALKILPQDLAGSQERLERFQREAESLAALNHPNIVHIYTVQQAEGTHFLTMELVEGESLEQLIPKQGVSLAQVLDLAVPLADALAEAHDRGIVHRDLKPANVMVDGRGIPKILDFGLAKLRLVDSDGDLSELATATMTQHGVVLGTIPYMSPEQVQGLPVDHRTDLFSFGVVLYELLTGRRPFEGSSSAAIAGALIRDKAPPATDSHPGLPRAVLDLLDRCLEKDPNTRVQTAAEIRGALQDIQSGKAAAPRQPISVWFHDKLWRTPALRVIVSAAVLASLVLVYVGFGRKQTAPEDSPSPQQPDLPAPAAEPIREKASPAYPSLERGRSYARRYHVATVPEDFDLAMAAFQEALALEPESAEIPARIAGLYKTRMQNTGEFASLIPEIELWALRAIELDSGSFLGWQALYNTERFRVVPNHRKILEAAFRASSRSEYFDSKVNPNVVEFYSAVLAAEGWLYELQFSPLEVWWQINGALNLSLIDRYDEAFELVDNSLQLQPNFFGGLTLRADLLTRLGRTEEAREQIANVPPLPETFQNYTTLVESFIDMATGDEIAIRESLATQTAILLDPESPYAFTWPTFAPSTIYHLVQNGYLEEALDLMSRLHEADLGDPSYDWLRLSPMFHPMRGDPRFQAVEAHAKENFDLMMEYLDRARENTPLPAELEQVRVELIEQLGG